MWRLMPRPQLVMTVKNSTYEARDVQFAQKTFWYPRESA